MDLRKLKKLIDLVQESGISELEITEGEEKVRISRVNQGAQAFLAMPSAGHLAMPASAPAAGPAAAAAVAGAAEAADKVEGHIVKSPMVGTFYRSSSPGGKPFVDAGSTIKEGEPICIIEAMKIMNEIEADKAGKVTQILCENGQAVEFGQPLFIIE